MARSVGSVTWNLHRIFTCKLREEWLEYRKTMKTSVTGSGLSMMYGMGYESLNEFLKEKIAGIEKINSFKHNAIEHGIICEGFAKTMYLKKNKITNIQYNGDFTKEIHTEITLNNKNTYPIIALITPDMVLEDNTIVEFKCPYQTTIQHANMGNMSRCAILFSEKYPYGRGDAFVQSLFYSIVLNSGNTETCYFFWDKTDAPAYMITYKYQIVKDDGMYIDFMENICKLSVLLNTYDPSTNYRMSKKEERKKKMTEFMRKCFLFKEIFQMRVLQ